MIDIDILWCEKYRPKKISDCILPVRILDLFKNFVQTKEVPNLLLFGPAGVGKTTVAKALCEEIGCDYMVINGSDENGVDTVRHKIKNYASSISLSGGRKVIIIDEADYMSVNAQAILRNAIEEFSKVCSFIFTCNFKSKIIDPLHSRCACIDFILTNDEKSKIASGFFKKIQYILNIESVEYEDKVIVEIIKKFFPDFRRIINELQRYSNLGKIDTGVLSQVKNIGISELIGFIKSKDFRSIRKWVATNDIDSSLIFRQVYDELYNIMKPMDIPKAVIILADYQYKDSFAIDKEINIVACFTEIMISCEFL